MRITRRTFLATSAALMLSACGGSTTEGYKKRKEEKEKAKQEEKEQKQKAEEEKKKPIVDKTTTYSVYRCDIKHGVTGTFEAVTENTQDFSDSYAILNEDNNLSFEINGVPYNGKVERGDKVKTQYSGISDYEATKLLLEGNQDATVGSVLIEAYLVDNDLLIDMVTKDDQGTVFANFYLRESK